MTFDDGQRVGSGNVTEQFVRLIIQAVVTLAVVGGWFYLLTQDKPIPTELATTVVAVILSWFGQGMVGAYVGYKRDQASVALEQARAAQVLNRAQDVEEQPAGFATRAARRFTGADR